MFYFYFANIDMYIYFFSVEKLAKMLQNIENTTRAELVLVDIYLDYIPTD